VNEYTEGDIQHVLAEDPRIAEQGIRAVRVDDGVVLVGEVESPDRCAQIESVLHEEFPGLTVRCDVSVTRVNAPQEVETI
jgi:hypothetical protein